MYIKYVRLKGFRTYKDLTVFSFAPGYNVIVGLNGSGKSNALLAISFVLAENMEHADRSWYLYKGDESSLSDDFTAQVEVVFDLGRDSNIPGVTDSMSELCLKRIFSKNKDVYQINGKQMTCREYRQYLEGVNLVHFSKNSPSYRNDLHFIVKQGAVSKICNMTFEERLNAFRDVIGHRSFDAKMEDAEKTLQSSKVLYNSVETRLGQISRKLESLDLQRGEVLQWQKLDEKRQGLNANLVLLKIDHLQQTIESTSEQESAQSREVADYEERLHVLEAQVQEHKAACSALETDANLEAAATAKRSQLISIESQLADLRGEIKDIKAEIVTIEYKGQEHDSQLSHCNTSIETLNLQLEKLEAKSSQMAQVITRLETNINEMLYKQQGPQLKAKDILDRLKKAKATTEEAIKDFDSQKAKMEQAVEKCNADVDTLREKIADVQVNLAKNAKDNEALVVQMENCMENRRNQQRRLAAEMAQVANLKVGLVDAQANFNKLAFSNQHVTRLVNDWLATDDGRAFKDQFVGVLIDLIKVKDEYTVAVEQVLGSRLFTIVVKDMACAKAIIKYTEDNNTNYTTLRIAALDILPPVSLITTESGKRALPLVDLVKYQNDDIFPLIHHLLHDFRLVPDVDYASKLNGKQLNCVTPDGQIFYHKGLVSGGYVSSSETLLKSFNKLKEIKSAIETCNSVVSGLEEKLEAHAQELEAVKAKREAAKVKRVKGLEELNSLNTSMEQLTSYKDSLVARLSSSKLEHLKHRLSSINAQIETFNKKYDEAASSAEAEALQQEILKAANSLKDVKRNKMQIDVQCQEVLERINSYTQRRNQVATAKITRLQLLSDLKAHLNELQRQVTSVQGVKDNILRVDAQVFALEESVEKERQTQQAALRRVENETLELRNKYNQANTRLQSTLHALASLKLSKREAEDQLAKIDPNIVNAARNLHGSVNRSQILEQLSEINKKCSVMDLNCKLSLGDCSALESDHQHLQQRKDKIFKANAAITKSIRALQTQKEYNLVQMIHKMNDKISQVFQELVPGGRIKVLLLKRDTTATTTLGGGGQGALDQGFLPEYCDVDHVEQFTGMDIRVSFVGDLERLQPLHQLSGGQKTLVSLAFILASQRLQVAPFYLFDEIDAALDETCRNRVASLLQKQCLQGSQCIVTTFREQLLAPGEVFYEIISDNGTSVARRVDLDSAIRFVTAEPLIAIANA